MADLKLTQAEADALIVMEKHLEDDTPHNYPGLGGSICIPLISPDKRENFLLDISRGRIDLMKGTYQNRGRQIVVLVRLDFGGQPHRNPDDVEVPSPHLHIYREGYGDKWAVPVPADRFSDLNDLWQTLTDFMEYCNITQPPFIVKGLFS
jgi:hypothetical protein